MGALLDDGRDEPRKLWFLPALLVGQFDVDKVEPLERMILLNSAEEVNTTVFASVSLNSRFLVHDAKL